MDKRNSGGLVATRDATTHTAIVLTLALVLGVIGFLAAGSVARSASGTTGSVSLRTTKLGAILVNSRGHTLYMFAKDKNGKSSCSGNCAKFWPPSLLRG
jgi:predicted lipoprotein with Yx(FWY)xxD motif